MATEKQIAANRRNARKSTGPQTERGKARARQNAFRHGLTAQTVISIVENADEYTDLETLIIADYEPQTTIERVLVERLASLLWRLRRAVAIETGLYQIHESNKQNRRAANQGALTADPLTIFRDILNQNKPCRSEKELAKPNLEGVRRICPPTTAPGDVLCRRFFRLANLDANILERIERYEVSLWRQTAQTMSVLNSLQAELKFYGRTSFRKYNSAAWK